MPRDLIDLLWRDHPDAPQGGSRGPRARVSTSEAVRAAVALADADGLAAVTVRRLAGGLGVSAMALYTHVGSRDDLLVLMADAVHATAPRPPYADEDWRARVRAVAEANLALLTAHAWLLDVADQRTALGPGTIAKYDHELHALDSLALPDVDRDAALTFVLDFVRGAARARRPDPHGAAMAADWATWGPRLAAYLGDAHPLAQRVGAAAGAEQGAAYSPDHAWRFGLDRVLDALDRLAPGA
ncbi:TetR/AcrR family transcriptional regulator C-terminal domain-containing protein [Cellulomonas shaoxiangyii]|uniref:TetR family transcriptional regulator n=1 Tax=Cellulomonas shaoxiangyii TaxID=2566013 RepID=A0A4P7SEK2_9CELL|nr:TetR/AcrR family transcriptional regulator C-terminal domain-containing protein [Cellulomonas shaoxiangyii]QCB92462.1 TetR family transcriptional regulator [Cellulomonas shaoxiangyii]TGY84983.1 TetR family transcriptional regulator [Cellulomonas shaoxiangyii]